MCAKKKLCNVLEHSSSAIKLGMKPCSQKKKCYSLLSGDRSSEMNEFKKRYVTEQAICYKIEAGRNNRQFVLPHKHFLRQNSEVLAP